MQPNDTPHLRMSLKFLVGLRAAWVHAPLLTLCSELIDNSLDAQAVNIAIEATSAHLFVRDDGGGIRDLTRTTNMGDSIKGDDLLPTSGRYGAGGKLAALGTGNIWTIDTCSEGQTKHCRINFQKIIDANNGEPDEYRVTSTPGVPSYTEIEVTELHLPRRFSSSQLLRLQNDLANLYQPAIRSGVRITFNGTDLPLIPRPALDHHLHFACKFDGRDLLVYVGVIKHGDTLSAPGLLFETGKRVLKLSPDTSAFGPYANAQVLGWVRLIEDKANKIAWGLSLDKTDFAERDALGEFLFDLIEDVLRVGAEAARQSSLTQRDLFHQRILSDMFAGRVREARARQTVLAETERREPTQPTGRKRTRATNVTPDQPGSVKGGPTCPVTYKLVDREKLIGGTVFHARASKTSVHVDVAGLHPAIASLKNKDIAFTWGICMVLANEIATAEGFERGTLMNLLGIEQPTDKPDPFGFVFAQLLDRLPTKLARTQEAAPT
jgi:hypothetical protein